MVDLILRNNLSLLDVSRHFLHKLSEPVPIQQEPLHPHLLPYQIQEVAHPDSLGPNLIAPMKNDNDMMFPLLG